MQERIKSIIEQSIKVKQGVLNEAELLEEIENIVDAIMHAFKEGHRLYLCGNGGSAADAQHLAAEFSGRFYKNRAALPAEALHTNSSYLTAVANDFGYDQVYSRLIEGIAAKGDVLIGLSTSGNSTNVVAAFEAARVKGVTTIGFTGQGGGQMKSLSDYLINVPSGDTPRIQENHILIGHIICELVEEKFFSAAGTGVAED